MHKIKSSSVLIIDPSRTGRPGTDRIDNVCLPFEPSHMVDTRMNQPLHTSQVYLVSGIREAVREEYLALHRAEEKKAIVEMFWMKTKEVVRQRTMDQKRETLRDVEDKARH